jgi:ABC-type amino acid transport system permease subunit
MDIGLGIAGVICVAMAFGHQTIGLRWVLPHITEDRLPGSPFGPSRLSVHMVRVTWYIVTIFVLAFGVLLLTLAWDATVDTKTLLLRWFAATWLAAAAMALWVVREGLRNVRQFLRLPVPFIWVIVAVLCWKASI